MIGRAVAAFENPARRARLVRWLWLVSTAFTLLGFGLIGYLWLVRR